MTLKEIIDCITDGTKIHIGVLFFGSYGGRDCELPPEMTIHSKPTCVYFKTESERGFRRCYACRNMAVKKAVNNGQSFGGLCINGIYEYTYPVKIGNDVAAMIYIGNIYLSSHTDKRRMNALRQHSELLATLDTNTDERKCRVIAQILSNEIGILLSQSHADAEKPSKELLIDNIRKYTAANIDILRNISQIAQVFHYNPVYLGHLFKQVTGSEYTAFLNSVRLSSAERLLTESDRRISEIAFQIGYNDVSYFNRQFKKKYGISPGAYRKRHNDSVCCR